MAKKIAAYIKLQVKAGEANPSPPVGPALGQRGVNIMEFCKAFNAKTQDVEIEVHTFKDRPKQVDMFPQNVIQYKPIPDDVKDYLDRFNLL